MVALFDHKYVYVPVPPDTVKSIWPVLFPKHKIFDCVVLSAKDPCGCETIIESIAIQPLVSVTVIVKVPALNPVIFVVIAPFDHKYV